MEQYSNLNVHGKITQKANQADTSIEANQHDVVIVSTLNERVPVAIPEPTADQDEGKALIVNQTGDGFEFGEAGKVDAIQIDGTAIAGDGAQTKIANILTGAGLMSDGATIKHSNSVAAETTGKGSSTAIPIIRYDSQGHILSVTTATVYPPTTPGTSGQVWKSDGSEQGAWTDLKTINSASLVGSGNISLQTPLTAGTDYVAHNSTTASQVYATNGSKVDEPITYSTGATQGHIVQRGAGGQITVPESPDADTDAASKKFVNSSISNNTAKFLGTYEAAGTGAKALGIAQATVDAFTYVPNSTMESTTASAIATKLSGQTVSNLDYVFVAVNKSTTTVPSTIDWFWRFKATVSGSTTTWEYEFTLNNSSFTQAQWNAINSGIEASDVTKLDGIEAGAQVNTVTGVKGNSELTYRTGNINITKTNIGLGSVENTALSTKVVASTGSASTPIYIDSSGVTQAVTSVSTSLIAAASPSSGGTGGSNGLMTAADKEKLNSIASGAEVNVQADWNQATNTADDYIKNKPTIGSANFKVQGQGTDASTFSANATSAVTLNIKQGGATTVTAGTNEITISSTDQSVDSSAHHYTPSTASGGDKSASASGATAAWSIDVVKGVTLNTDGKGHVTGISVTSGKIPANPNTDILVKQTAQASTTTSYPLLASAQSSPTSGTAYEAKYSTSCYIKSNEVYSNGYATWNTNSLPFAATDVTLADM